MTLADELAALPESLQDKCFLTEDEKAILRRAVEALRAAEAREADVLRIADAACGRCGHARCCACGLSCYEELRALLDSRPSAATEETNG